MSAKTCAFFTAQAMAGTHGAIDDFLNAERWPKAGFLDGAC